MCLCSVHGFFTGATSAYLKDSLLPFNPILQKWSSKDRFYQKSCHFVANFFQRKKYNVPMSKYVHLIIYNTRIWCVSAGRIFLKSKRPSNQHCLRRRAGRALLKSKDPERAVFFHWVPTRGPAAGEKGRRSKIPPFSKGKDEISLVVEEWISGYQKGWVNWFVGQNKFWGPKELCVGIYFDF